MTDELIQLPAPTLKGTASVEEIISKRRSIRQFKPEPATLAQLSQLLWAAQGKTLDNGYRSVPSAGATFPLEIYVFVGEGMVVNLSAGIYHYKVDNHSLGLHLECDLRHEVAEAALGQESIENAPLSLVICANINRTTSVYGKRGERYVLMEAGHAGQNISLQAIALGLGTVMIGAFYDEDISEILKAGNEIIPLYIIPVGKPL